MKKKSKSYRVIACLVAGCVILTGAVFANIDNANGYSSYKNAIKNLLKMNNYTADVKSTVYIDDIEIGVFEVLAKVEDSTSISYKTSASIADEENYKAGLNKEYDDITEKYLYDGFSINSWNLSSSDARSVNVTIHEEKEEKKDEIYNPIVGEAVNEEVMDRTIKFMEVAADGFIGDIKNNFVYLGEEEGIKNYNVTLSKEQMPSIITSGLSLFSGIMQQNRSFSTESSLQSEKFDYNSGGDIVYMMFVNEKEPFVKSASCDFSIDENGNLTHNVLSGTIAGYTFDGKEHTISLKFESDIYDIGTTVADKFDVYGLIDEVQMLDGSTKTFKELVESCGNLTAIENKKRIHITNLLSSGSVYIIDGKEVSNSEYNRFTDELEKSVIIEEGEDTDAATVGIIGGADGPTAIYVTE